MHPDERPARPTDARYRATGNVPSSDPRPESSPPPSRSQAQVATRRIAYAVLISLGVLLLLIGVDLMIPQFSVLGLLILLGVLFTRVPAGIRMRTRQVKALMATLRGPETPPPAGYTQQQRVARPVVAPPPPLSDAHDAIIRETHRKSGSADGQGPPALPPRTGPALPAIRRGAQRSAQGIAPQSPHCRQTWA